jgi:hypothetical protein
MDTAMRRPMVAAAAVVLIVWLGLWIAGTGVLVYSASTRVANTYECRYFVGLSLHSRVVRKVPSCAFFRKVRR